VKILILHNRYQMAGGEDAVVAAEKELLESNGHSVTLLEADNQRIMSAWARLRAASGVIYSAASRRRVAEELERTHPDVVHVHNFFPLLSPSVYDSCRQARTPVVQTLHNYRLLCPNALFFRDGRVCEDCLGKRLPWPGVIHACYHQSRWATAAVAAMSATHRMLRTWNQKVDKYIALTEFGRRKLMEGGLMAEKIVVKPNFLKNPPPLGIHAGRYALFVGRLSAEKGIETLLAAWKQLGAKLPLKIVGDGPLSSLVDSTTRENAHVTWLGRLPSSQVAELMRYALVLIFPSLWYEGFPMTIVEAFASGLPVVASRLGAMTMVIEHGRTGRYFCPGDAVDLAAQVDWVLAHPSELQRMRQAARAEFEAKYTAERNYEMLMQIYTDVLEKRGAVASS